jgi:HEPN domain-containing protein
MPEADAVRSVVRQWIEKAGNDLKTARNNLRTAEDCPTDMTCFHAQQCIEKCIKAALVNSGIEFAPTHDISIIAALLPAEYHLSLTPEQERRLTRYATVTRYPGDYEPIPLAEATDAVELALSIRNLIGSHLPVN